MADICPSFVQMDKRRALEASVADYAKRLGEASGGDELSKRTKKRILQKLGKLKKDLAALSSEGTTVADQSVGSDNKSGPDVQVDAITPVLSKEERKLKLRFLNKDLSELAQKKQLALARKLFEQGLRKGIKVDVHSYTNLINAYVRCGDLDGAEATRIRMIENGIVPNLVTYTTLLKGYSESGDMKGSCKIYFEAMRGTLTPNVRTLNTFLRTCVRTGMVKPALHSFHDFMHRTEPSQRSETGGASKKQKVAHGEGGIESSHAPAESGEGEEYTCDASTFEYLIGLLCRTGNLAAAEKVLAASTATGSDGKHAKAVSAGGVNTVENAANYVALATAQALQGDFAAAQKWCDLAMDALKRTETATLKDSMLKRFQATDSSATASKKAGGDDTDSRSVALFLKHRRTELEGQLEAVQEFLGYASAERSVGLAGNVDEVAVQKLRGQHAALRTRLAALSQVLYFGFDGQCDYDGHVLPVSAMELLPGAQDSASLAVEDAQAHIAARLLLALRDKFGLDNCTLSTQSETQSHRGSEGGIAQVHKELKKSLKSAKKCAAAKLFQAIDANSGCIDFPALFAPLEENTTEGALSLAALPVKLEICSGNGEWAVAQAAADWIGPVAGKPREPRALWVALELRCDRIQHTLAHYLLTKPPAAPGSPIGGAPLLNLALVGGNAAKIVPDRIAPASVTEIFINHPQPPDRVTGGGDAGNAKKNHKGKGGNGEKNQGAHLLTQGFFADLVRILKPGGTITIVTDNQAYGKSLAASIAALPAQTEGSGHQVLLVGGVDRYKLPKDWDHSLDDSHPVLALEGAEAPTALHAGAPAASGRTVDLWRGEAGPEVGHVTAASSYFDRMWDLGQKKRRWFVYVRKVVL